MSRKIMLTLNWMFTVDQMLESEIISDEVKVKGDNLDHWG